MRSSDTMKIALVNCNTTDPITNIGLAYLISSLEKKHSVKLVDLTFHPKDYLEYVRLCLADKPDIVGFSVTSFTFQKGIRVARYIRQLYPDLRFIFGGVHPTLMPEETIRHPLVDAICVGEGEKSFLEYLDSLEKGNAPYVNGIWSKNAQGVIIKNPPRPFEENLDIVCFPNWSHWNMEQYLNTSLFFTGSISCLASRGCLYECTFCSNNAIKHASPGNYYRTRSPQNVIDEIKDNLNKYWDKGMRAVFICDEIFGANIRYLKEFCSLYRNAGFHKILPWSCQVRCDIVTDEWAQEAHNAGCLLVSFGIDSGNDYIRRKVYGKNISREQIIAATRSLKANRIQYKFNFLVGCPEETKETISESIRLTKELKPIMSYFNCYQPLPKTELGEKIWPGRWDNIIDNQGFVDLWNKPRILTNTLTIVDLHKQLLRIHIRILTMFLINGLRKRGIVFLRDVFSYVFSRRIQRKLSLQHPFSYYDLVQKTTHRYIFEDWTRTR